MIAETFHSSFLDTKKWDFRFYFTAPALFDTVAICTGCIVSERFKSYQKRNMIPVPLEEAQWKKKGRLRYKIKEERQSKEVR